MQLFATESAMRLSSCAMCALLLAGAGSAAAPPAPSWYAVEVLVFRYTGPDAAQGESWPAQVPAPATTGTVYPPAVATGPYAALPAASTAVAAARVILSTAPGYAPVVEMGWRQPQTPPTQAKPVALAPPGTAPAPESATGAAQVEGRVTVITANRKPNVSLRLRMCETAPPGIELQPPAAASAPPVTTAPSVSTVPPVATAPATIAPPFPQTSVTAAANASGIQCFVLRQRRFVTPGQFEYFDNPAFGALVLVREIKAPE